MVPAKKRISMYGVVHYSLPDRSIRVLISGRAKIMGHPVYIHDYSSFFLYKERARAVRGNMVVDRYSDSD